MEPFDKDNYDNLSKIDKLIFDQREKVCKECEQHETCQQESYPYMKPIIKKMSNGYGLSYMSCGKNPRGKIKSYIKFNNINHLFENEKKKKYVKNMLENNNGFIYGLAGTGKSHMIAYIANELNKKGLSIYYELSTTIAKLIWNFDTQKQAIADLKNYDVVLIDDIGSEMLNEKIIREYYMFLFKERVDNNKPLFITSNYSVAEFAKRISEYVDDVSVTVIVDRLKVLNPKKYEDSNFRFKK